MSDIYRSPLFTIKNLLRTGVIPYLVTDYARNALNVLQYRNGRFILGYAIFEDYNIPLVLAVVSEEKVDELILDSTKVKLDNNIITDTMFNELLEALSHASDIVRSRMAKINNKKGTGFTEDDFEILVRMATKAREDVDFYDID